MNRFFNCCILHRVLCSDITVSFWPSGFSGFCAPIGFLSDYTVLTLIFSKLRYTFGCQSDLSQRPLSQFSILLNFCGTLLPLHYVLLPPRTTAFSFHNHSPETRPLAQRTNLEVYPKV